jgi:hypothetical protein
MTHDYDDDYPTCLETYATLRVFSDAVSPEEVTAALGKDPTSVFRTGERRTSSAGAKNPYHGTNGWFYSTKGVSKSRDCRRHLDLLAEAVLRKPAVLAELRDRGCTMDVTIFYVYTQGGPTISPLQMRGLADAGIDVWWDLYRDGGDEDQ